MRTINSFILILLLSVVLFAKGANGQALTGAKTIPGDYATIQAAISDLNLKGVGTLGVTFNVAAGYTETITAPLSITATGTSANQIIFQKSGSGTNPLITAYTGTGTPSTAVQDGIWNLIGSDYVTIDRIDLYDPNTSNPATMEYGYGLFKASATNGCKYNTIKNCVVTLNRDNCASATAPAVEGSRAINLMSSLVTTQTTITAPTSAAGTNSYNKFYGNTLQNCNIGIALIGYAGGSPFTLCDLGNDVGGSSLATANNIINFGGGSGAAVAAAGIRTLAQYTLNVSYNTVNNNNGSGVNHPAVLRGMLIGGATSANATINYNTLSLINTSGTSTIVGIDQQSGVSPASNTIDINNNTISCSVDITSPGTFTGINSNGVTPANLNIKNNTFPSITKLGTGTSTLIIQTGGSGTVINISDNTISNITCGSGAITGISQVAGASGSTVNGNTISGWIGSGPMTGLNVGISTAPVSLTVYNNNINGLITTGASTVTGINNVLGTSNSIYKNKIYNLQANNASGFVYGITVTGGTGSVGTYIYNNLISGLTSTSTTQPDAIRGINITSTTVSSTIAVYYNTIYLNAAPGTTTFGCSGVFHIYSVTSTTAALDMRNNIIVNVSTPGTSSGLVVAFRRSASTDLNNFVTSDNNLFYAGTPAANRVIFYEGTTSKLTLALYQARVTPRDVASITGDPLFHSSTNLHVMPSSPVINAGTPVSTPINITDDFDGTTRHATTPTIGAYETTSNSVTTSGSISNPTTTETTIIPLSGAGGITFTPTNILNGSVNGYFFSTGRTGSAPGGIDNISPYYWALSTYISSFTSNIKFYFNNITGNGVVDYSTLKLLRRDGQGSNWSEYSSVTLNAAYIQANGVTGFSEWAIGGLADNPLPVELSSFTANIKGWDVELKWITVSETNNKGFEIQRTELRGENLEYRKTGFIAGFGTKNTPTTYNFIDSKLNTGKYKYRLKQIDNNGNYEYHNLSTVIEVGVPSKYDLSQNFPNPFNPTTKIDFDLPFDSKVNIILYDMSGKEVKTLVNDSRTAGFHTVQFNASDLSSGVYFYRIISKSAEQDFVMTKKMTFLK